jgi:hypothetical protein
MIRFFCLGLVALIFSGHLAFAQSLKVGMTSKTLFYLPFYAAQKKDFSGAENLKVEIIMIVRSDVQLQALPTGEINFGALNADGIIAVNEKGANLTPIRPSPLPSETVSQCHSEPPGEESRLRNTLKMRDASLALSMTLAHFSHCDTVS